MDALDMGLRDRVAIVTGAGQGIGRAVAEILAALGTQVVAADVDEEALVKTRASLEGDGRHVAVAVDLVVPDACERLVHETATTYGGVDILVNAHACMIRRSLDEVNLDIWQQMLDANLRSYFLLCRAAAEIMKTKRWGRIVNFSSQAAFTGGFESTTVYAISKGGVNALTRSLARSLAPYGICVNSVAPGGVETRMMREDLTPIQRAKFIESIPLGRLATPVEVARVVAFVVSEWGGYMTGATLDVSGGMLMH